MDTTESDALDAADMQCLGNGQDEALSRLMDRHATALFQFLYRMLGNESDANDLAQETFVRVYQHRTGFKPGAKFKSWLFTIAANLARNHHRWQSRHPAHSIDAESTPGGQTLADILPSPRATPDEAVLASERARAVHAALLELPVDMREALVLCEWEELSVAQAAQVLKTTPKSVESRLYRARNLLRDSLKKWLQAL